MSEYPTPPGDSLQPLVSQLKDLQRQLNDLQRPSGTNIGSLVSQVQAALVNINATVIAATNSYLSAGTVNVANLAATGSVTAAGNVSGGNVYGGNVFAASAGNISGNITAGRTTAWARTSDGFIGNTLSSLRFKADVLEADIDPLAVLGISVKHYRYIAELRKRDDPTYEGYVGPHYHVAQEVGMIAEDLHAAGLWQFVIYERDVVQIDGAEDDRAQSEEEFEQVTVERLRLNTDGEPIPQSIHYELWSMAVLIATKHVWDEHLKVRADTDRILDHLGLAAQA